MKKKIKRIFAVLLLAVGAVSAFLLLGQLQDNGAAADSYEQAAAIAFRKEGASAAEPSTSPSSTGESSVFPLEELDFAALREVNPDVLAWIRIPGTGIDYPLMQGSNNDYYLYRTWEGERNDAGSIYLDYRNAADFSDFNSIVYGHNRGDGSMFSALTQYSSREFWEERPYVYLVTDEGIRCYEIFSSFQTEGESFVYTLGLREEQSKENYIRQVVASDCLGLGIVPEAEDQILTLSTCSGINYSRRWVILAREIQK